MLLERTYPVSQQAPPHALALPPEALSWLAGTTLHRTIHSRRALYQKMSQHVYAGHSLQDSGLGIAMGIVLSRAMSGADPHGNIIPLGLAPIIDFANHSATPNSRQVYGSDEHPGSLILESHRAGADSAGGGVIKEGEEICISYGDGRDSSSFLALYGFLPRRGSSSGGGGGGGGAPKHLINENDMLTVTVTVADGNNSTRESTRRRVSIPQTVVFAAEELMTAAATGATADFDHNNSPTSASASTPTSATEAAEVMRAFESILLGYMPGAGAATTSTAAVVAQFASSVAQALSQREAAFQAERPGGSLVPRYMAACRTEGEREYMAMCAAVVAGETAALEALLRCIRLWQQHARE
jgi:hypothetical protein